MKAASFFFGICVTLPNVFRNDVLVFTYSTKQVRLITFILAKFQEHYAAIK